jgi:hypothetical protein
MPSEPDTNGPSEKAVAEFAKLASDERIRAAMAALERNGISCLLVDSGAEARTAVRSMLAIGAEVFNNTSRTLEVIGVAEDVERSGHYQPLRPRLYQMDREMQGREMRQLAASPDFVVGSVHAVTEDGSLLIASGAGHVILVIGGQRIVPDLTTALRRIQQYCLPLEDRRAPRGVQRTQRRQQHPCHQPSDHSRPDHGAAGARVARVLGPIPFT